MLQDYSTRQALAKLGYESSIDELEQFEADYLTLIASEFARLKNEDSKRHRRRK